MSGPIGDPRLRAAVRELDRDEGGAGVAQTYVQPRLRGLEQLRPIDTSAAQVEGALGLVVVRFGNPATRQRIIRDDPRRIGRERECPVDELCDALTRRSLKVRRQHGDRPIRVIDCQTRERNGTEHIQNMIQLVPVWFGTTERFHMKRVLLGEPSRNNQFGELREGDFPGRASTRFAFAELLDGKPDVMECAPLARGRLLQQRQAEHDLAGCEQAAGEVGQHLQARVGFLLGPARRQAERRSTGLAEGGAWSTRPEEPSRPTTPWPTSRLSGCLRPTRGSSPAGGSPPSAKRSSSRFAESSVVH
ncbi:hypothetical protein [Sorangium sp. So ce388]|uniref:hypothetical protein n=1 Tax=Sorangium sp. So ce388 TaxID=3133309 RepID=UPI003F5BA14F